MTKESHIDQINLVLIYVYDISIIYNGRNFVCCRNNSLRHNFNGNILGGYTYTGELSDNQLSYNKGSNFFAKSNKS